MAKPLLFFEKGTIFPICPSFTGASTLNAFQAISIPGVSMDSLPPTIARSSHPPLIALIPSPIAILDEAHAHAYVMQLPCACALIANSDAAAFGIPVTTLVGLILELNP